MATITIGRPRADGCIRSACLVGPTFVDSTKVLFALPNQQPSPRGAGSLAELTHLTHGHRDNWLAVGWADVSALRLWVAATFVDSTKVVDREAALDGAGQLECHIYKET